MWLWARHDVGGNVAVERLLASGYLGNRFVDRVIAALFRRRVRGGAREALSLQALTVGAPVFVATRTALTALVAIITAFMRDRPWVAVELVIALGIAAARGHIAVVIVSPIILKSLAPLVFAPSLFALLLFAVLLFAVLLFALLLSPPLLLPPLLLAPLFSLPLLAALVILGCAIAGVPRWLTAAMAGVIIVPALLPRFVGLALAAT